MRNWIRDDTILSSFEELLRGGIKHVILYIEMNQENYDEVNCITESYMSTGMQNYFDWEIQPDYYSDREWPKRLDMDRE